MTEEDVEDFENKNICRFCGKDSSIDKVSDLSHLTGKYRGPAHNTCCINVTQQQSKILPFLVHNFSN